MYIQKMERNPDGWDEVIILHEYDRSGDCGSAVSIGCWFSVSRWAVPLDSQPALMGSCRPWIPRTGRWDHVLTSPYGGRRIPFDELLWGRLMDLSNLLRDEEEDTGLLHLVLKRIEKGKIDEVIAAFTHLKESL